MIVDETNGDQQLAVCRLDGAVLVIVVEAVEEDLAAVNCGNGFTSALLLPRRIGLLGQRRIM